MEKTFNVHRPFELEKYHKYARGAMLMYGKYFVRRPPTHALSSGWVGGQAHFTK
jgi:hypothetical protein